MPDQIFSTTDLVIASTFVCLVIAMVVWLRVEPNDKRDKHDSSLRDQRTATFLARIGHWANALVNFVIGVLLGVAINGLARLMLSGAWVAVFTLLALFAALFLIVWLHDRLGETLFPSGIRPARKPRRGRQTPLFRRLSLPLGLVIGVVLAVLGWDQWLSGWMRL
jgi:hypothetical protein